MEKIVIIAAVKNECDIIESFCRYNLAFSDCMLIYENHKSSDNTREIIQNLIDEGLPIFFEAEEKKVYYEAAKGILAKTAVKKYNADLVLQLDADEFLYHVDGINPRETLESLEEDVEYQLPWRTYVYDSETDSDTNIDAAFMPDCFSHYRNPALEEVQGHAGKAIASRYLLTDKRAVFHYGGHWLVYPKKYEKKAKIEVSKQLVCAHYPIRNRKQATNKAVINYINKWTLPEGKRPPRDSYPTFQLGILFSDIKEHGEILPETMKEVSLIYSLYFHNKIEEIDKLRQKLGADVLVEGVIDTSFCTDKMKLRYSQVRKMDENRTFLRATLKIIDEALENLETESLSKTREILENKQEINKLQYDVKMLSSNIDRISQHRDALQIQSDDRARQIDEIYASRSWRLGNRLVRMFRVFVPGKR